MASKETVSKNEGETTDKEVPKAELAPATSTSNEDKELDDLLDDAIGDFDKPVSAVPMSVTADSSEGAVGFSKDKQWFNEFAETMDGDKIKDYLEQMSAGKDISELLSQDKNISELLSSSELKKIMENTSRLLEGETSDSSPEDLKETISETLRSISEGIDNLQSSAPDELTSMFSGLDMNSDEPMMPFMQNIMEMFLSKEVLYPSMDALCKSFPAWLERNKETLPEEDYNKYKKQHELMLVIVKKLDEEDPNEAAEVKKERFNSLVELMQELQKFGHPPKELVAETGGPFDMSQPQLPMDLDPSKCVVM